MSQVRLFTALDISASGLKAQRARMNVIAQNIANAGSTKTEGGGPYRRQVVDLEAVSPGGPIGYPDPTNPSSAAPNGNAAAPNSNAAANAASPTNAVAGSAGGATGATPITTDKSREAALAAGAAPTPPPTGAAPAPPTTAAPAPSGGVRVARIREDDTEFQRIHDPSHPDADADGFVEMPNVNMVNEMVDMMLAARAYEANLAVMTASKDLLMRTLTIGKQ